MAKTFRYICEDEGWNNAIAFLLNPDNVPERIRPDVYLFVDIYNMAYTTTDYYATSNPDFGLCFKIREYAINSIIELMEA